MPKSYRILLSLIILALSTALVTGQGVNSADDEFYKDPIYDEYFFVREIACTTTNCPSPNTCIQQNAVCRCDDGNANYFDSSEASQAANGPYCQYQRKKQLTAFLLHFFLFSGAGQFYAGNIQYAIPQLIITLSPCALIPILIFCGIWGKKEEEAKEGENKEEKEEEERKQKEEEERKQLEKKEKVEKADNDEEDEDEDDEKDDDDDEEERPCLHSIAIYSTYLFSGAFIGWWLADVVGFGNNNYTDSHGIPLIPW